MLPGALSEQGLIVPAIGVGCMGLTSSCGCDTAADPTGLTHHAPDLNTIEPIGEVALDPGAREAGEDHARCRGKGITRPSRTRRATSPHPRISHTVRPTAR